MRRLLPLALVLAACTPQPADTTHQPDSGAANAGVINPSTSSPSTAGSSSSTASTSPADATPPKAASSEKTATNPSRLYQLADLKKVDVSLKGHTVHLWVMDDEPKQQEGMMFLEDKDVKPDEGMLFAFSQVQPNDGQHGFWMHNTLIPLDIIYFAPSGKLLNVGHGKRLTDKPNVAPAGDYLNVIELKAGTAARLGLKPGDVVKFPKVH